MKKLLNILGIFCLSGTSSISVVSCTEKIGDNFIFLDAGDSNPFYNEFKDDSFLTNAMTRIMSNLYWNFFYSLLVLKYDVNTNLLIAKLETTPKKYQNLLNITYYEPKQYEYFFNGGDNENEITLNNEVKKNNDENYYYADVKLLIFTYESEDITDSGLRLDSNIKNIFVYSTQLRCYIF